MAVIRLAEQTGLINEIGRWVLERSISDRAQWLQDFPDRPLDLSVNVSGRQLFSDGFRGIVENILSSADMDPATLILELTENVLIDDNERAATVLADLNAMGVRLALDDFGTGYSCLSYLRRLPVDIVKIDRAFISDINEHPQSGAIVKAVTDLTHALGLTVTAEGIESEAQRDHIKHLGCDSSQGYYYAKPMPASAIRKQLQLVQLRHRDDRQAPRVCGGATTFGRLVLLSPGLARQVGSQSYTPGGIGARRTRQQRPRNRTNERDRRRQEGKPSRSHTDPAWS